MLVKTHENLPQLNTGLDVQTGWVRQGAEGLRRPDVLRDRSCNPECSSRPQP